jgi:hypothetical protein
VKALRIRATTATSKRREAIWIMAAGPVVEDGDLG